MVGPELELHFHLRLAATIQRLHSLTQVKMLRSVVIFLFTAAAPVLSIHTPYYYFLKDSLRARPRGDNFHTGFLKAGRTLPAGVDLGF